MYISQAAPEYRPVNILLEDQDDLDQMMEIVASVAENRINHTPPDDRRR